MVLELFADEDSGANGLRFKSQEHSTPSRPAEYLETGHRALVRRDMPEIARYSQNTIFGVDREPIYTKSMPTRSIWKREHWWRESQVSIRSGVEEVTAGRLPTIAHSLMSEFACHSDEELYTTQNEIIQSPWASLAERQDAKKKRFCGCWVGARAAARQPRFRRRSGSQVRDLDRRKRWASDGGIDCRKRRCLRGRALAAILESCGEWRQGQYVVVERQARR